MINSNMYKTHKPCPRLQACEVRAEVCPRTRGEPPLCLHRRYAPCYVKVHKDLLFNATTLPTGLGVQWKMSR